MSRDTQHTPGPWKVMHWADAGKGFFAIVTEASDRHVADVFPFGKRVEGTALAEHEANARLIAAAPDMLAALQAAAPWMRNGDYDSRGGVIAMNRLAGVLEAAIAKATTPAEGNRGGGV